MLEIVEVGNFNFICEMGAGGSAAENPDIKDPIYIKPFCDLVPIDLRKELSGSPERLHEITKLSSQINGTVLMGVATRLFSKKHLSVMVVASGYLRDIADRAQNPLDDEYGASDKIKVLKHKNGKIGLLIDTDGICEDSFSLIQGEVDIVVCISRKSDLIRNEFLRLSLKHKLKYLYIDNATLYFTH